MNKLVLLVFFVLSLILTISWFWQGKVMAGGEAGILFYNLARTTELYSYSWYQSGPGTLTRFFIPFGPMLFIFSLLQMVGLSYTLLQALMFFSLFFAGMCAVYLLHRKLFPDLSELAAGAAGIFYLFNLFSMSQVWSRGLYTQFYAFAILPLLLYLYICFCHRVRWQYVIYLILVNLLLGYAYGFPSFSLVLLLTLATYFVYQLITLFKSPQQLLSVLLGSFIFGIVLAVVNLYWLIPTVQISGAYSSIAQESTKVQIDSLHSVSQYFTTDQMMLLKQSYYFGKNSRYYGFYSSDIIFALSLGVLAVMIFGLVHSRKQRLWKFVLSLLIVGWFISKGTNNPFGYSFYHYLFATFPISQLFRNSYEKFGLVFLLAYALFFGNGAYYLSRKISQQTIYPLVILLTLFCGVLVWPLWNGFVLQNKQTKVPEYYGQANQWLEEHSAQGLIHLPLSPGDGVVYDWGYNGIEPSEFLFSQSSISKIVGSTEFDQKYKQLVADFNQGKDLRPSVDQFGVDYLIVHHDIDPTVKWRSTQMVEQYLASSSAFVKQASFGKLDIYQYQGKPAQLFVIEDQNGRVQPINFHKISPVKYQLQLPEITQPVLLKSRISYNPLWRATINGTLVPDHLLVDDYANGWQLNQLGSYTVIVSFVNWPWN